MMTEWFQDETACQQWLQKQASVASGFSKGTPLLLPNTGKSYATSMYHLVSRHQGGGGEGGGAGVAALHINN